MSIALISNIAGSGPNGFTTGAIDTSGANLLAIALVDFTGTAVLSDSKGNTWLLARTDSQPPVLRIYYAKNATVGSGHTFTVTGASTFAVLSAAAFSGADTTAPLDQTNGNGGGTMTTGFQPGSVTPTTDNQLIFTALSWGSSINVTSVTGATQIDETDFAGGNNFGGGDAYAIQTTATAVNPAWNWTGGTVSGNCSQATFKAAAAGATQKLLAIIGVGG